MVGDGIDALHGQRTSEIKVMRGIDLDDPMLIFPAAAMFKGMEPLLTASFIGPPAFTWVARRDRWWTLLYGSSKEGSTKKNT